MRKMGLSGKLGAFNARTQRGKEGMERPDRAQGRKANEMYGEFKSHRPTFFLNPETFNLKPLSYCPLFYISNQC
jgi:hypothetical protein